MADQVLNYSEPVEGGRGVVVPKRISWAAVFAGVLVALAVEVLFLSFGFFIGFRLSPGAGSTAWSVIWYFVGAFFSLMAGGWVAGFLAGNPNTGRTHGIVTWGLTTVATFAFLTMMSWGVVNQTLGMVKAATLATAAAAPTANRTLTPNEANRLQEEANAAINQAQQQAPLVAQQAGKAISNTALVLWLGFLIGAVGALVGGAMGAPKIVPPRAV